MAMVGDREVLVLYYSQHGAVRTMARHIARGVNAVDGVQACLRTVPTVSADTEIKKPPVPEAGDVYVGLDDLQRCHGLALGSPSRFGGMAASLKAFLEQTTGLWLAGTLCDKPACVFTSSSTQHGGQEMTLFSMMVPLLHHGALIMGLPYTEAALSDTQGGGTPYGPSHVAGTDGRRALDEHERQLCHAMGRRLAQQVIKSYRLI